MISTNAGYGGDCPVRPRSPAGECVREGERVGGRVAVVGRNQGGSGGPTVQSDLA